jgi:hypothetical protein
MYGSTIKKLVVYFILLNLRMIFKKLRINKQVKVLKMYWVWSQSNEPKTISNDQKTINFLRHIYVMPL